MKVKKNSLKEKISQRKNFEIFEEIFMCGYPGGKPTFQIEGHITDITQSPIIQEGKLSSLMPGDDADTNQGMILDIIGTGGSSGSPIVHKKPLEVIGIAISVVGASIKGKSLNKDTEYEMKNGSLIPKVTENEFNLIGQAKTGLVFSFLSALFRMAYDIIFQLEKDMIRFFIIVKIITK